MGKKLDPDTTRAAGYQEPASRSQQKARLVTRSVSLGRPLVPNLDNVAEVLEMIEHEEKWRRGLKTRGE